MKRTIIICSFIILFHQEIDALKCYTCSMSDGDLDTRCVTSPGEVQTGNPVSDCDKEYCTLKRVDYKDPANKVSSIDRGCTNKPDQIQSPMEDDFFITYYSACRKDLCNGGNGKEDAGSNLGPDIGPNGIIPARGSLGTINTAMNTFSLFGIVIEVPQNDGPTKIIYGKGLTRYRKQEI